MSKVFYIHTIKGSAAYYEGHQICYSVFNGKPMPTCTSLKQIRKEQKASMEWRKKQGYESINIKDYSHRRYKA
jgi:hypothetical protein